MIWATGAAPLRQSTVLVGGLPGEEMFDVFYDGDTIHLFASKAAHETYPWQWLYLCRSHYCRWPRASLRWQPKAAKSFITKAIAHGLDVGQGYGPTNPMAVLLTADCADSSQH